MSSGSVRGGLLLGVAAYAIWGLLPLYISLLRAVSPLEVLAHRVIWSIVLLVAVVSVARRWASIRAALTWRTLGVLAASAALIGINWMIYIWAVNNHHTIATSLGYFINPLVNVALGVIVLGERLRRWQGVAIALAGVGVLAMAVVAIETLWISLSLALTFAFYGLLRKIVAIDALGGLTIETLLLGPAAAIYLAMLGGAGAFGPSPVTNMLLIIMGLLTALPLLMFAASARRLPYSTLALIQYIAPTLQFLVATMVLGEPLRPLHGLVFVFIWAGCALFAWDSVRAARAPRAVATAV